MSRELAGIGPGIGPHANADQIRSVFTVPGVLGVVFMGHGEGGAIIGEGMPGEDESNKDDFNWDKYYVESEQIDINYKLGLLWLFSCQAGLGKWNNLTSRFGLYYAPRGTVSALKMWESSNGSKKKIRRHKIYVYSKEELNEQE